MSAAAMMRPAAPRLKGTVLRQLAPWVSRRFTAEAIKTALASLPNGLGVGLIPSRPDFGALATSWYDARVWNVFDLLLSTEPHLARTALAREAAEALLRPSSRGITSGIFTLVATPALYARYAQRMWDTSYDSGRVTIEHRSPSVARHRVQAWQSHHDFACEVHRQSGAVLYELMGLRNVQIVSASCSSPMCESTYSWSP